MSFHHHPPQPPPNAPHHLPQRPQQGSAMSSSQTSSPSFEQGYPSLPSFPPDHTQPALPRIGQTRCYWALLTADLEFIYLDPVLASHLEDQAQHLVGKSLISFVHPEEQASAKHDLGSVLENRTLHGSVTRVRFSRLSRVRRQLGHSGNGNVWSEADKIALDANYMAVDIVINYASEGLVLCFIHAIVDLDPRNDNDESNKTDWTNWCGTPYMPQEELQCLWNQLMSYIPQPQAPPLASHHPTSLTRVFQILAHEPGRPLLLSWPPDQHPHTIPAPGQLVIPTSRDFAKLAEDMRIGGDMPNSTDAKTSCTRRYKATQVMDTWGGEVESIYIPHGTVIFACHKFTPSRSAPSSSSTATTASPSTMHISYPSNSYSPQPPTSAATASYYQSQSGPGTSGSAAYPLPPLSTSTGQPASPLAQSQPYSPQRWPPSSGPSPYPQQAAWGTSSPTHSMTSLPPSVSNLRSQSGAGGWPPQPGPGGYHHDSHPSPVSASYDRPISPYSPYAGSPAATSDGGYVGQGGGSDHEVNVLDTVPPPRRRVSPMSMRDQYNASPGASAGSNGAAGAGGRASGNRPVGILKCSSCKATSSPEWRKGPSGKKELCNACGLRYARSRAKKEGTNLGSRRRKDRVISGGTTKHRDSATPPIPSSAGGSPSASAYSGLGLPSSVGSVSSLSGRWDENSSSGNPRRWSSGHEEYARASAGARWGDESPGEVYSHPSPNQSVSSHHPPPLSATRTRHHPYEDMKPSPSPPAQNMSFVHYGVGGGAPSPLSNPPVSAGGAGGHGNESPLLLGGLSGPGAGGLPSSYERDNRPQLPPMGVGLGRRDQY